MTRSGCSACTALSASVPVVTTVWRSSSARKEGDFSSRKTAVLLEVTSLSMRDPLAKITTKQWGLAGAPRPELRGTAGLAAAPVQPPLDSSPCGRTEARPAPAGQLALRAQGGSSSPRWTARPAGARRLVQPPLDSSPCGRTEARPAPAGQLALRAHGGSSSPRWTARPAGARRLVQPPLDSSPCGRKEARPAPAGQLALRAQGGSSSPRWTARPAGARRLVQPPLGQLALRAQG